MPSSPQCLYPCRTPYNVTVHPLYSYGINIASNIRYLFCVKWTPLHYNMYKKCLLTKHGQQYIHWYIFRSFLRARMCVFGAVKSPQFMCGFMWDSFCEIYSFRDSNRGWGAKLPLSSMIRHQQAANSIHWQRFACIHTPYVFAFFNFVIFSFHFECDTSYKCTMISIFIASNSEYYKLSV